MRTSSALDLARIASEAHAIGAAIEARKSRAMIYDVDENERLAAALGVPAESLYFLPYAEWRELQHSRLDLVATC